MKLLTYALVPLTLVALQFAFATPDVSAQAIPKGGSAEPAQPPVAQRRTEMLRQAMAESEQNVERYESQIEQQLKALRERSISDIAFEDVFRMLHLQKVELGIELDGLNARLKLLKREAENSTVEDKETESQRALLERYVANQAEANQQLQQMFAHGEAVSKQEVANGEQMLIDAKLRLKQFNSRAKQASPALVEAIFETTLDIAEKSAKQATVQQMLRRYIESRDDYSKLGRLKRSRDAQSKLLEKLMIEKWSLDATRAEF